MWIDTKNSGKNGLPDTLLNPSALQNIAKGESMKAFKVTGTFRNRPGMQAFSKEVAAKDKDAAVEVVMSVLGSKHRAKRTEVKVESVVEIKKDDVTDPIVIHRISK